MSTDETPEQPLEVSADEDWKQKVKAEDAALEQKLKEDAAQESESEAGQAADEAPSSETKGAQTPVDETAFPPADFSMMVATFSTQAMLALGMFPNPATNKIETNLNLARHCIDMLRVVEEKTKGNLEPDETNLLDTTLHQLRMVFVEQQKKENQSET